MNNLITLTVNGTHFYLVDCKGGKLLIDAGWTLPQFTAQMKAYQIPFSSIRYVMFTHHHPDHAGLVQNIKNISAARLIIHQKQIPFLKDLQAYYENKGGYEPIQVDKNDLVSPDRAALKAIGIDGELVESPGHSEDSISLALDSQIAFIGDLPSPEFVGEDEYETTCASWRKLIALNVQTFYHSHTDPIPLARIKKHLSG